MGGRATYARIFAVDTVLEHEVDERCDVVRLCLLVPQGIQHDDAQLVPRRDCWIRDNRLDALQNRPVLQTRMHRTYAIEPTFRSAPDPVARPCSTSPTSSNLSRATSLLNSPTSATCLLTLPPSLRNSGYSSTNRFISLMELMDSGECASECDWYDWTYDLRDVPRSPNVARWCAWKKGSVEGVSVTSFTTKQSHEPLIYLN